MKAYQIYPFSRIEVPRGHIVVIKLCVPGSVTTDLLKEKSVSCALETEMISRASTLSESGLLHARLAGISGLYGPLFHWIGTYGTISSLLSSFGRLMIVLDVPQLTNE